MAKRERLGLSAVRTEGAILPASILQRIHREDLALDGLKPEQYGLAGDRLREAASRAWSALQGPWSNFKAERAKLVPSETGTSVTRNRWINPILRELHFGPVEAAGDRLNSDDKEFPVSHLYGHAPLHLIGCNLDLDRRTPGAVGAAKMSPHGLVQSCLNARKENLWGCVTNGLKWRVLRDDNSLSRQSMVEFDLEAIFEGQLYGEFLLFFLVCHRSRLESETPEQCWLERWSQAASEEGKRALDTLRDGVQKSIEALGQGFLRHPANNALRERIRSGELDKQDYYRQLLRMVYRFLFLFVAEDRGLLLDPEGSEAAKALYADEFSTQRLRMLAERMRGSSRHHDLFSPIKLILGKLGQSEGCPQLALPALGGFLFSESTAPDLDSSEIANADLLEAIRSLAVTREGGRLARVDYKNLGTEELGSVYESLLELHPELASDGTWFELKSASGNERKTSGSYYTPDSLIQCLLDTALDPVVEDALKRAGADAGARAQAILSLRVIDPAVGSGHFLIAAAHRLAKRLAQVRTGEDEPSPDATRQALREVVGKCLYGIDLNPMAAELCKVSLWIEALEPGRPLSFLDHHVVVGNSLLGSSAELIAQGIPDEAFEPMPTEDKAACKSRMQRNRTERDGLGGLFEVDDVEARDLLAMDWKILEALPDRTLNDVQAKEQYFASSIQRFNKARLVADAWCSAFVSSALNKPPLSTANLRDLASEKSVPPELLETISQCSTSFNFLHTDLAFPEVFGKGGFDVVVGNPPYLFLSGKGSPSARLRREGHARAADLFDRMVLLATTLYPTASEGCRDLFKWFIARGLQLVNREGRLGYVVPSSWVGLPRFADIRRLTGAFGVAELVDLGFAAFPDLTVSTSYFVCRADSRLCWYANIAQELHDLGPGGTWRTHVIANGAEISVSPNGFSVYRHALGETFYENPDLSRLNDIASVTEGDHGISTEESHGESWPVVADWELTRHRPVRLVDITQLAGYSADASLHSGSRCIVRKTGDSVLCGRVADSGLGVTHQNAYVVKPTADWLPVEALVALLNSRMVTFLYRAGTLGQKGRIMAQLRVVGLRTLPVPQLDRLRSNARTLADLGVQLEAQVSNQLLDAVNRLVYDLYEVPTNTRSEIDSYCADVS